MRRYSSHPVVTFVTLTVVYVAAGKLGLRFAFEHPSASPIWPPTGIAIAALLVLGADLWPAILLGAFVVNATTAGNLFTAAGIAVGNTLEAVVAATLVRRFVDGPNPFERPRDVLVFAAAAGLATPASAIVGVTTLAMAGFVKWSEFGGVCITWWVGDLAGALIAAPLLMLWALGPRIEWGPRRLLEALLLLGAVVVTGGVVFGGWVPMSTRGETFAYLAAPVPLWAALRFGPRETATAVAALALTALHGTLVGFGPFAQFAPLTAMVLLQAMMASVSVTGLILAAAIAQQRRSEAEARRLNAELTARVAADARELQAASVELSGSSERYRTLMDSAPDVLLVADADGKILLANARVEEVFGYRREEVIGRSLEGLIPQGLHGRRRDGSEFPVDVRLSTVKLATGRGVCAAVRDVSEQRQAERALQESQAALAETQRQLAQSQKIEAVGRLAGGIAHDFNNLLGVILGFGELARKDLPPDHRAQARVEQIQKAAERAATLTRQLLAFSRKQLLQPRNVDLNTIARDMERMLRRLIGEDIRLDTSFAPDLWPVRADPAQIEQVIMNLAVNARDAMPGGGTLTLRTSHADLDAAFVDAHPGSSPGPHVVLSVSDTGFGMDAGTLSHLFEPFFTTKPAGQGTGLGLAMIYGVVKQSGGYISAQSEVGKGATFTVYLPRAEAQKADPARRPEPASSPRGTETVLLVEDEASLRGVMRETLQEAGYRVLESGSAEEAVTVAGGQAGEIHLLLTDVVMPGASGEKLESQLRGTRPGIRVVYMSGYTDEAISRHGVLEPGRHFLQKPFAAEVLLRAVRRALDAR
jgi:two-component system cell cycle sensor histidine kinase/response regulator CckA